MPVQTAFALVSLDADFAEIAALLGPPPKVIWLHCGNQPTAAIIRLLREHFDAIVAFERDEVRRAWKSIKLRRTRSTL